MRKVIIDTDTGSDDAVALMMALKSNDVEVMAITTVAGNVPLNLATKNALATIEVANGQQPPVYVGAAKPLMRDLVTATNVHGQDGMGDMDLIHPTIKAEGTHAVDAILDIISNHPGEIEIVTIGPVTNIALAIMKAPQIMQQVKHIYSMGTAGFGPGNTTPVAEFNVYVDAESYSVMLNAGIPITIIGFDLCMGDAVLKQGEIDELLASGKEAAVFAVKCNQGLIDYNLQQCGQCFIDLPDPVAMGVFLWEDIVLDDVPCHCYVCTKEEAAYGQVIIYDHGRISLVERFKDLEVNAVVCKKIDIKLFKDRLFELLIS